jgi:DNA-binding LacI/PurR family transcriptional regulator
VTRQEILRVAVAAGVDPRTVERVIVEGGRPRSTATRAAIQAALVSCGFKREAARLGKVD